MTADGHFFERFFSKNFFEKQRLQVKAFFEKITFLKKIFFEKIFCDFLAKIGCCINWESPRVSLFKKIQNFLQNF